MKFTLIAIAATGLASAAWADAPPPPPETPHRASYEQACTPLNVTLYFQGESAAVTPQARKALEFALDTLNGCAVTSIHTTSLSSDAKNDTELRLISEQRTDNVLEAVASTGVWPGSVKTDIVLTRSTNRADNAYEPIARRVEVTFVTSRPIAS